MKITILVLCLILFIGCNFNKKSINEEKYFPTKDKFILSEYHRYLDEKDKKQLDSLRKVDKDIVIEIDSHPIFGSFDKFGFTHLIILNNDEIYFHQEKPIRNMRAGNFDCVITENVIEESKIKNNLRLDSLTQIRPTGLKLILKKNEIAYVINDITVISGEVTISLKNDTLDGSLMYDIFQILESKRITKILRRMNEDELKAIERFQDNK